MRAVAALLAVVVSASVSVAPAATDKLDLKSVAAQRVLSVKVGSPREFPTAFEQLEQYCGRAPGLHAVTPEMSLGSSRVFYAAVGFEGEPRETESVRILELPPATVATRMHRG